MRNSLLGHTALAFGLMVTSVGAQELCSVYSVQRGDTLSGIANAAGVRGGFQTLYDANRDTLSSPNVIEVNQQLMIPCADGTLPGAETAAVEPASEAPAEPVATAEPVAPVEPAATETAAAEPAVTEAPAPAADGKLPPIKFITGNNFAPFTDESLPEGGLVTELVKLALERSDPEQEYTVTFINDWDAHLKELMPSGAFDMGFPWALPDCTKVALLSPDTQIRCTEYDASDNFLESAIGYYAKAGSELINATSYDQLKDKRICRPDGWFTYDLEALELVEPKIPLLLRAPTQVECWRALLDDKVDVVTITSLAAETDFASMDIADQVAQIPALTSISSTNILIPKNNPNGEAYLALLNSGLKELRDDGTWFKIVSQRMREHEEKQAAEN
jgi:LysM repeat protein